MTGHPTVYTTWSTKKGPQYLPDVVEFPRISAQVEQVLHDLGVAPLTGQVHGRRLLVDRVVFVGIGAGPDERSNHLKQDWHQF